MRRALMKILASPLVMLWIVILVPILVVLGFALLMIWGLKTWMGR